jgi:hypothetical protein
VLGLTKRLSGFGYDSAGNQASWGALTDTHDLANSASNVNTFRLRGLDAKVLRENRLVGGDAVGDWMFGKDSIDRRPRV